MTWTFQRHDNSSATKPKTHTHTEKEKHTNHKIKHKRVNTHNTETFFVVLYEGHTVHTLCFFALFRCCALERSLSRPRHDRARRQPRRAGEKPLLSHTHIHTHTHKHFSVSSLFHLQHSLPSLPLCSSCCCCCCWCRRHRSRTFCCLSRLRSSQIAETIRQP